MGEISELERKDTKISMLYELRLLIDNLEKETYTKKEILKIIDDLAKAKNMD